jgi:SagB-type dehydrogenase family enzyme
VSDSLTIVAHEEVRATPEGEDGGTEACPASSRSRTVPLSRRGVPPSSRPMVVPGVRSYAWDGALRLTPLLAPPRLRSDGRRRLIERTYREITISGNVETAWRILARLDGVRRMREIAAELPDIDAEEVGRLIATLVDLDVVDASGRTVRRFLHTATSKPVLPPGPATSPDAMAAHVTDGRYRSYPGRPRTSLRPVTPTARLRELRSMTHARRSPKHFARIPIDFETISAVLEAACGVSAVVPHRKGKIALRAHPSGGALYAIETYLHVLGTRGLAKGLYHYSPVHDALEHVRVPLARDDLVDVALEEMRESVACAGAVVFFAANFPRAERKYGSGGYRVLAIEAGHISESLLLCACAAGLHGRPNGGWYEADLNATLGFSDPDEQYLFSLLLGHAVADEAAAPGPAQAWGQPSAPPRRLRQ